ncbi:MAG TPA: hypothetical protein VIK65_02840 [Candidatus Limnocylindrales bacterium]
MNDPAAAFGRLPEDARERLEAFGRAIDHVHVDDLALYVARVRQPRHRRAVEAAEVAATKAGLAEPLRAAREMAIASLMRTFAERQLRVWIGGVNMSPNLGPTDERIRIAESVADAVTAVALDGILDADDRAELLGLWARLPGTDFAP